MQVTRVPLVAALVCMVWLAPAAAQENCAQASSGEDAALRSAVNGYLQRLQFALDRMTGARASDTGARLGTLLEVRTVETARRRYAGVEAAIVLLYAEIAIDGSQWRAGEWQAYLACAPNEFTLLGAGTAARAAPGEQRIVLKNYAALTVLRSGGAWRVHYNSPALPNPEAEKEYTADRERLLARYRSALK